MSSVSVLCIGDPHFKKDNIYDIDQFIEQVKIVAKKEKPDIIVVLGDLLHYHDTYYSEPYNRAIKFLESLCAITLTFLIIGNHDLQSAQQFLTDKHAFNACKKWDNIVIVDKVEKYEKNDCTFFFLPFVPLGRFEEALNTSDDIWEMADCIFCHQEFKGCKMGGIESIDGDEWPNDYPMIISGHIHDAQTVRENICYPGSPMQHGYTEGDKNIWLVSFSKNDNIEFAMNVKKIDLNLPKRKLIHIDLEFAKHFNVDEYKNTHLKLVIHSTRSEYQSFRKTKKYKELCSQGVITVYKPSIIYPTNCQMSRDIKDSHQKYGNNFEITLKELILDEKDEELLKVYRSL